jgi:hypothetical protein
MDQSKIRLFILRRSLQTVPAPVRMARNGWLPGEPQDVLQSVWNNGGKPDVVMTGGFNKQQFSTFTGQPTPTEVTKAKKDRGCGQRLSKRLRRSRSRRPIAVRSSASMRHRQTAAHWAAAPQR